MERLFVLKTLSRTQRATKVKKFVGFSLKPLRCRDPALPPLYGHAYSRPFFHAYRVRACVLLVYRRGFSTLVLFIILLFPPLYPTRNFKKRVPQQKCHSLLTYSTRQKNSTKVPLTVTVLPHGTVQSTVGVPLKYRRVPPKYHSVPSLVPLKYLESTIGYL